MAEMGPHIKVGSTSCQLNPERGLWYRQPVTSSALAQLTVEMNDAPPDASYLAVDSMEAMAFLALLAYAPAPSPSMQAVFGLAAAAPEALQAGGTLSRSYCPPAACLPWLASIPFPQGGLQKKQKKKTVSQLKG